MSKKKLESKFVLFFMLVIASFVVFVFLLTIFPDDAFAAFTSECTGGTKTYTDSNGLNPRSSPAYANGYTVHTFTSSSTFTCASSGNVDYLVIAGGGGGGHNRAGGGGAGGFLTGASFAVTPQAYTITIGNGGAGTAVPDAGGSNGQNSSFSTIVAIGGGGGQGGAPSAVGSGGSGGGSITNTSPTSGGTGTAGPPRQGYNGGSSSGAYPSPYKGSGGGGAGEAGHNPINDGGDSKGGNGVSSSISGTATYYAGGGGGGGGTTVVSGGLGGGGSGGAGDTGGSTSGTANTGGGGGGEGGGATGVSGSGGSGVIIIRYSTPSSAPTVATINPASGVNSGSASITSVTGTNFVSGATVKLTKTAQSDISCTGFSFTSSSTLSSGSCPITGAVAGVWNVVVTNPDIQTGTLTNGFTVNDSSPNTNISPISTEHFVWSDNIGWINFYSTDNINVASAQLTGYASSSLGYIALDCATSPNGNICGTSNFKVLNDGSGNLSGWAYNDIIGWISFNSVTASSSYFYQVTINPSTGDFSGFAWNDLIGWLSFNCLNDSSCGTVSYKVKTYWVAGQAEASLTSSIFDVGVAEGVALNTIMWRGSYPAGTSVKFQIASNLSLSGGDGTGTIDSVYKYAWNDFVGWINFNHSSSTVNVGTSQLTGFAYNSNIGEIALDCATSPSGDICGTSNFKVNRNSSTGDLSGYAWNDSIGWISFNCSDPDLCGSSNYKVNVNTTTGAFTGYAWNDYVGWISFNCSDPGLCGSSNYRVNTGATASWDFKGPDGSGTTYYTPIGSGYPIQISLQNHNNVRYFRYKIFLYSDAAQSVSPRVDDVILNYSP